MKIIVIVFLLAMVSCNSNNSTEPATTVNTDSIERPSFFPVTAYFKGQLFDIRDKSINPLKHTIINNKHDSVWVQHPDLENTFAAFLEPVIDSLNLVGLFTETKFLDRTLNAYTFTYSPTASLPDSMTLRSWDVLIDPVSSKVKRVYLVKTVNNKTLQLTWISDQWAQVITMGTSADGKTIVEKEEKINWDF